MADGNIIPLRSSREVAWRTGLRVVEQSPAGRHEFPAPAARYLPAAEPGAVYLGTVRFEPEQVEALIAFFQRHQAWSLHDALLSARDGITEPPPEAA